MTYKYASSLSLQFVVSVYQELGIRARFGYETIQNYKASLFDIHHVIKPWKVNEMSFYNKLLEKCSEFSTATETAIGKIHVMIGNLKKRFTYTTASADPEKENPIKKTKRENATKSTKDQQKRLVASAFNLLRTTEGSDKIAKEFKSSSSIAIKVSLTSLEKFLNNNNLKPDFILPL